MVRKDRARMVDRRHGSGGTASHRGSREGKEEYEGTLFCGRKSIVRELADAASYSIARKVIW